VIVTALKLFKLLISEVATQLDSPLDIPILSPIYKLVIGNELTALDLACFVCAIPTTIIFKIASGEAPYPDDNTVQAVTQGSTAWSPKTLELPPPPGLQSTVSALSFLQLAEETPANGGALSAANFQASSPDISEKPAPPPPATQASARGLTANQRTKAIFDLTPIVSAQAVLVTDSKKFTIASARVKAKQAGQADPGGPLPKLRWLSAAF
jgi:hypothetical protein